jgi:hypothetical protein
MLKLHSELPPTLLFAAGMAFFPAFVFMPFLPIRTALCLLFLVLSIKSGKRFRPLTTLVMAASIILFNLLVPFGKVMARVGGLALTQGALLGGIEKAVTVQGLIWLSHVVIRPELRFPGMIGELLAGSFAWLARITAVKGTFQARDPFGSLDRLLLHLWDEGAVPPSVPQPAAGQGMTKPGRHGLAGLAVLALLCLGPYALVFVKPTPVWLTLIP